LITNKHGKIKSNFEGSSTKNIELQTVKKKKKRKSVTTIPTQQFFGIFNLCCGNSSQSFSLLPHHSLSIWHPCPAATFPSTP